MLKAVKIDPQSIQATTLQVLREKRIMLQQQSEEVRVNLLINELVEEAVEQSPMNADLYKRLMDGYLSEREFIDALEGVTADFRYHLALAFLDSHNLSRV